MYTDLLVWMQNPGCTAENHHQRAHLPGQGLGGALNMVNTKHRAGVHLAWNASLSQDTTHKFIHSLFFNLN